MPSAGVITSWRMPGGRGVRIDEGYCTGSNVSLFYDSLLAKSCFTDKDKKSTLLKANWALEATEVDGVCTNLSLLRFIITDPVFSSGEYDTSYIQTVLSKGIIY